LHALAATLYLSTGNNVQWIRYGEWLLTCPVILIHLSNITGLKDDYTKRTMMLLISDIGCIVCGVTAALAANFVKWIFFCMGLCYGSNTYFHAAKVGGGPVCLHLSHCLPVSSNGQQFQFLRPRCCSELQLEAIGVNAAHVSSPCTSTRTFPRPKGFALDTALQPTCPRQVYVESYHVVPKGVCRNLVRLMAWFFFSAWTMFPLLFMFGPEGFKIMTRDGSNIAHTVADIMSKQIWSMLGHILRVKVRVCNACACACE
jgi:hypothetical protein